MNLRLWFGAVGRYCDGVLLAERMELQSMSLVLMLWVDVDRDVCGKVKQDVG